MSIQLYDLLKQSYEPLNNSSLKKFEDLGYQLDTSLSNKNNKVFYNQEPGTLRDRQQASEQKKLIFIVKGTNPTSAQDVYTDVALSFGRLKNTDRYKDSDKRLKQAKQKYGVSSALVVGHSLGAIISKYIAGSSDKVVQYNSASVIGEKPRDNVTSYRTSGDLVSLLNKNTSITLDKEKTNISDAFGSVGRALSSHDLNQIKNVDIPVTYA
jgi:hypothetical protein